MAWIQLHPPVACTQVVGPTIYLHFEEIISKSWIISSKTEFSSLIWHENKQFLRKWETPILFHILEENPAPFSHFHQQFP